mmetsp:Transcript_5240/g.10701  ORF Transcript_5240/g.10701 Transcript_5240/m.10701 type:complete len:223 (+) Transcript_5240:168-836(+)
MKNHAQIAYEGHGRSALGVFLLVPNLIGYGRLALCLAAFLAWRDVPRRFMTLYLASFLLDAADGFFARVLNQSSQFGALLDMVADRCATAALLAALSVLYQTWSRQCLVLIYLDGISHWFQMCAGKCEQAASHKDAGHSALLRLYYWRPVLTFVCLFNELFLIALYASAFPETGGVGMRRLAWFSLPIFVLKQVVSVRQVVSSLEIFMKASYRARQQTQMIS